MGDKLKRVIPQDLGHEKQEKSRKKDEYVLDKQQQAIHPNMENNLLYPPSEKIIQKLFGKY